MKILSHHVKKFVPFANHIASNMVKASATLFFFILSISAKAQQQDSFKLYFDLGIPTLNARTQQQIDRLIYNDRIIPGNNVLIIGYADYLGTEGYNKALSEKRANNVADYLIKYGIDKQNIKLCIGKGEVERKAKSGKGGYPTDRRVDIVVQSDKANIVPPTSKVPTGQPDTSIIDVSSYQPGQTFVLRNIYFFPESHRVLSQSYPELDRLYNVLKENPKLKIRIEGHVCCINGYEDAVDKDNGDMHLSVNRANAIYYYLIKRGIPANRLQYAGFGKTHPIVENEKTEADARKNRRVEIRVLEK